MYCYVWSFVIRPECLSEFQAAYGPDGEWVRFFRSDPEYLRTRLLKDRDNPTRFVTIDFWTSHEASVSFRERFNANSRRSTNPLSDLPWKKYRSGVSMW